MITWLKNLQEENALPGCDEQTWGNIIRLFSENSITGGNLHSLDRNILSELGVTRIGWQLTIIGEIHKLAKGSISSIAVHGREQT